MTVLERFWKNYLPWFFEWSFSEWIWLLGNCRYDQIAEEWQSKTFKTNSYKTENKIYDTRRGEKVRSKSEAIIADMLFEMGIPYHYEYPLRLRNGDHFDDVWALLLRILLCLKREPEKLYILNILDLWMMRAIEKILYIRWIFTGLTEYIRGRICYLRMKQMIILLILKE